MVSRKYQLLDIWWHSTFCSALRPWMWTIAYYATMHELAQ